MSGGSIQDGRSVSLDKPPVESPEVQQEQAPLSQLFSPATALDLLVFAVGLTAAFVSGATVPANIYFFGGAMDQIGLTSAGAAFDMSHALVVAERFFVLGAIGLVSSAFGSICINWTKEQILARFKMRFVAAVLRQDIAWF